MSITYCYGCDSEVQPDHVCPTPIPVNTEEVLGFCVVCDDDHLVSTPDWPCPVCGGPLVVVHDSGDPDAT